MAKSKSSKKRKASRAKREGTFAIASIAREPSGRRQRAPMQHTDGVNQYTENRKAERLNGRQGCVDDWIDLIEAHDRLTEKQAEALRRYRNLIGACRSVIQAPKTAKSVLAQFLPDSRGLPMEDEDAIRRIVDMRNDAGAALHHAHRRDVEAIELHIMQAGIPLPRSIQRIASGSEWLVDHFGL